MFAIMAEERNILFRKKVVLKMVLSGRRGEQCFSGVPWKRSFTGNELLVHTQVECCTVCS